MLSPAEIAALSPADRLQLFEQLAATVFPTAAATAEGLGITRGTLWNWQKAGDVPIMAALAIQACAAAPTQPKALIEDARQLATKLEAAAKAMAEAASVMASVVRRLPDPS